MDAFNTSRGRRNKWPLGVCVAGVNVKGEYRLWSPGSQQQCFGTRPSVIGTYKYITLYMIDDFVYQLARF